MAQRNLNLLGTTKTAIIDASDFDKCSRYIWRIHTKHKIDYARSEESQRSDKSFIKRRYLPLHHLIMGKAPEGLMIDHINGDGLDNRKENLRYVTNSENQKNRRSNR